MGDDVIHRMVEVLRDSDQIPENPVLLLRVLNPLHGGGPYKDGRSQSLKASQVQSILQRSHGFEEGDELEHPGWAEDNLGNSNPVAFPDLDKAVAWFDQYQLHLLEEAGFWLAVILVDKDEVRYGTSGKQVSFDPHEARTLTLLPPTVLVTRGYWLGLQITGALRFVQEVNTHG